MAATGARPGGDAPAPGERRSWWLREALAAEGEAQPAPPLEGDVQADVVIVGGGYTGLWTAWFLAERAPGARIVLLEQDICGGGPSGRNGGFVHGWWDDIGELTRQYGADAALAIARAADEVVDGIGEWCVANGADAWYTKSGYLRVNAFPTQGHDWDESVARLATVGAGDELVPIDADQVQAICASPAFRTGLMMPSAASVQPARLARALRHVLLARGVTIHEGTPATILRRLGGRVEVTTPAGRVRADQAVLAINAWAAGWPGLRSRVLAWGSYIVMTEPIPDRLAELGWTGGELLSDSRFTISYFRTTPDGRIAFGAGVGAAGYGGRIGSIYTDDANAVARVVRNFRHLLPMLDDVRIEDAWGGPIDITGRRMPEIASTHGGRVHFAHGFAGNGAGPSRLAGRILAGLVDGGGDPAAALPFVGRRQPVLPPEPLRFMGARMAREALIRIDDALDDGRRPSPLWRGLAALPKILGYRIGH